MDKPILVNRIKIVVICSYSMQRVVLQAVAITLGLYFNPPKECNYYCRLICTAKVRFKVLSSESVAAGSTTGYCESLTFSLKGLIHVGS
jgi:hypothetical protein